jgi:predicted RNA-binding protein with PIN domain
MHRLIDGYNLMHAVVDLSGRLGPDELRKRRNRFLNDLAYRLGPVEAARTTVVFDAHDPPPHRPRQTRHKGLTVMYSCPEGDADTRIEQLIREHSAPRNLTVVSSDRQIRQAALRRKAKAISAEEFWSSLGRKARTEPTTPPPTQPDRPALSAEEAAYWREQFRDVLESAEAREIGRRPEYLPSDEDIARIEREIEQEDQD